MTKKRTAGRVVALCLLALTLSCLLQAKTVLRWFYNADYTEEILQYANEYGVDPYLIMGIIKAESSFNAQAESHKGARGLMQITDETARWLTERLRLPQDYALEYTDPEINIRMGCYYVRYLLDQFGWDKRNALASYNAGPNVVRRWLADPDCSCDGVTLDAIPYPETERYVNKALSYEDVYRWLYGEAEQSRLDAPGGGDDT